MFSHASVPANSIGELINYGTGNATSIAEIGVRARFATPTGALRARSVSVWIERPYALLSALSSASAGANAGRLRNQVSWRLASWRVAAMAESRISSCEISRSR